VTDYDILEKEMLDIFFEMPEGDTLTDKEKEQLSKILKNAIKTLKEKKSVIK